MPQLRLSIAALTHEQVNVMRGDNEQRTYPTHEAFFKWLEQVKTRLPQGAELVLKMPGIRHTAGDHPANVVLYDEIVEAGFHVEPERMV